MSDRRPFVGPVFSLWASVLLHWVICIIEWGQQPFCFAETCWNDSVPKKFSSSGCWSQVYATWSSLLPVIREFLFWSEKLVSILQFRLLTYNLQSKVLFHINVVDITWTLTIFLKNRHNITLRFRKKREVAAYVDTRDIPELGQNIRQSTFVSTILWRKLQTRLFIWKEHQLVFTIVNEHLNLSDYCNRSYLRLSLSEIWSWGCYTRRSTVLRPAGLPNSRRVIQCAIWDTEINAVSYPVIRNTCRVPPSYVQRIRFSSH